MEPKHLILGLVEAVIWYVFLWYFLDTLKRDRNPWIAAFVLLVWCPCCTGRFVVLAATDRGSRICQPPCSSGAALSPRSNGTHN